MCRGVLVLGAPLYIVIDVGLNISWMYNDASDCRCIGTCVAKFVLMMYPDVMYGNENASADYIHWLSGTKNAKNATTIGAIFFSRQYIPTVLTRMRLNERHLR